MRRGLGALFVALALLQLIPVWAAQYFPTADGPSHLYNSWVLRELVTGRANDAIKSHYEVNWRPHPNWTGHVFMAAAMSVVPPLAAEKLYVSAIILLLFGGAWRLATAVSGDGAPYAFLSFPFVYHSFLFFGFYNFSLSVGLYLLTIATWWRRRNDPRWRSLALIAALLLFSYFTHPMATAFAIGSIGLLWLCTLRGRRLPVHARHLLAIVPAVLLLLWFTRTQQAGDFSIANSYADLARSLLTMASVFPGGPIAGGVVTAVLGALALATLFRAHLFRRDEDAFFLLFLALTLIYFFAPPRLVGGGEVNERLAVFLPLVLLPWFTPRLPRAALSCIVIGFSIAAISYPLVTLRMVRGRNRQISRYLEGTVSIPRGSVVMPLVFDSPSWLSHAVGYAAIDRQLVDLRNFEPAVAYFPIAYRRGTSQSNLHDIETRPETVWVEAHARGAEHVFAWRLPEGAAQRGLFPRYELVSSRHEARLYSRRSDVAIVNVLLPFVGTESDFVAANGTVWRIDQQVTNASGSPVRLDLGDCALVTPCQRDLEPGETAVIRSQGQNPPYTLASTRSEAMGSLRFSTTLRRVDARGDGFSQSIPSVEPDEFRSRLVFPNTRISGGRRLHLRVWAAPFIRALYRVRVVSHGRELASRSFATGPDGFQNDANLLEWFPALKNAAINADIVVEVDGPTTVWALIVSTDAATTRPEVLFPTVH